MIGKDKMQKKNMVLLFIALALCAVLQANVQQDFTHDFGESLAWKEEIINPDASFIPFIPYEFSIGPERIPSLVVDFQSPQKYLEETVEQQAQTLPQKNKPIVPKNKPLVQEKSDGAQQTKQQSDQAENTNNSGLASQENQAEIPALQSWIIPTKTIDNRIETVVSMSVSKKGSNSIIGGQFNEGISLFFNRLTKEKQINGHVFRGFVEDDASDIIQARRNIETLKNKSPVFMGLLGDKIMQEITPVLVKQSLIGLFPVNGSYILRHNPPQNIIYYRPCHRSEIALLVRYGLNVLKKNTFGIFYEDSPWGRTMRQEFIDELKKYSIDPVTEGTYPEGTVSVASAVKNMIDKAPSIIFCASRARPATLFITEALNKKLYKSVFFGLSELVAIQDAIKELHGVDVITSAVVPDPVRDTRPLAVQFRADMKKYLSERVLSLFSFEGYINALLLYEACKKMKQPFTTKKLLRAFERYRDQDLLGLPLSFDEAKRTLSSHVWINQGSERPYLSEEDVKRYE